MFPFSVHFSIDGAHVTVNVAADSRRQACNAAWLAVAQQVPDAIRVDFTRVTRG